MDSSAVVRDNLGGNRYSGSQAAFNQWLARLTSQSGQLASASVVTSAALPRFALPRRRRLQKPEQQANTAQSEEGPGNWNAFIAGLTLRRAHVGVGRERRFAGRIANRLSGRARIIARALDWRLAETDMRRLSGGGYQSENDRSDKQQQPD